jgi:hypothetical protein
MKAGHLCSAANGFPEVLELERVSGLLSTGLRMFVVLTIAQSE